jgi:hypothetical protein
MGYTPDQDEFWIERGIDFAVRDARPYTRYRADNPKPVQDAYDTLPSMGQKATTTRKAKEADGLVIHRHRAWPELGHVYAELRPDKAISTARPKRHWHGFGDPPPQEKKADFYQRLDPNSKGGLDHRWKWHTVPYGVTTEENKAARARGEEPGNEEGVHITESPGKYHFPPSLKIKKSYTHDHDEQFREKRFRKPLALLIKLEWLVEQRRRYPWLGLSPLAQEVIRAHWFRQGKYSTRGTAEEERKAHVLYHPDHDGEDLEGDHTHEVSLPDADGNLAMRLDVHPWAQPLFAGAEEAFFSIEGCLKNDAILSAILKERRKASVFSVPSVTLWEAPELPEFVRRNLVGKRVIVVPDSDWIGNDRVIEQARLCRTYLRRLGVEETYVAAPPLGEDGKVEHKGVDDFLGAGGTLDELSVLHREIDEWAIRAHLKQYFLKKDRLDRDAHMLFALAVHASDQGHFYATLARFARVLGVSESKVERAIHDLEALDAIDIDGEPLEIRQSYFTRGWGWGGDEPVITIKPKLWERWVKKTYTTELGALRNETMVSF